MGVDHVDRARRRIRELGRSARDAEEYRNGVLRAVNDVVPWDAAVFSEFDPATLLFTAGTMVGVDPSRNSTAVDIEFGHRDVDLFADLARDAVGVAVLSRTVHGNMGRSARYCELFRTQGLHDELRAVARSGNLCWAGLSLLRERGRDFTDDDVSNVAALEDVIAEGQRITLLRAAASAIGDHSPNGPAVVVLGEDGTVQSGTTEALDLLSRFDGDRECVPELSVPVQAVAWRQRSSPSGIARVRLRAADGSWLVLHAAPLRSPDGTGRTVVTIEPARPPEVVSIVAALIGLSARESEVLEHLLAGRSSIAIGRKLFLSPHTVNEHVRHIFEKAGVRNRKELMTWLFFSHYAQKLEQSAPAGRLHR